MVQKINSQSLSTRKSGTFRKNTLWIITLWKNTLDGVYLLGDGVDLLGDGGDLLGDGGGVIKDNCCTQMFRGNGNSKV